MTADRHFFLVGPTACGKHEVSLHLAEALRTEIFSIDSMKVYRGLNIGTAKPTPEARQRVRHHWIDILDVSEPCSAGRFVADASRAKPGTLFVGGTFLYYKAFVYGLFSAPSDPAVRRNLEALDTTDLRAQIEREDPVTASRLLPGDRKRMIRALEVLRLTGRPISEWQKEWRRPAPSVRAVCLLRSRSELRRRIESRTRRMFDSGLLEEAEWLCRQDRTREVDSAIGYAEALAVVRGSMSMERAVEETVRRTWIFCRKQLAWIRHLPELRVLNVEGSSRLENLVPRIRDLFEKREDVLQGRS